MSRRTPSVNAEDVESVEINPRPSLLLFCSSVLSSYETEVRAARRAYSPGSKRKSWGVA